MIAPWEAQPNLADRRKIWRFANAEDLVSQVEEGVLPTGRSLHAEATRPDLGGSRRRLPPVDPRAGRVPASSGAEAPHRRRVGTGVPRPRQGEEEAEDVR